MNDQFDLTSEQITKIAKIYQILSNRIRLEILLFLRHVEQAVNVSTIVDHLHLAQPIVSKQLGILLKYQLVKRRKHGNHAFYTLGDSDVIQMIDAIMTHAKHEPMP